MKALVTLAAAAVFALAPVSGAWAVDVINEDNEAHVIFVGNGSDAEEVEIDGNQTLEGICDACEILLEDNEPLSVKDDQIVVIKNGKTFIRS